MRICIIGAGALGGTFGGLLARQGHEVTLVDPWREHIAAIEAQGLRIDGVPGDLTVHPRATTTPEGIAGQQLALVATDSNHTAAAATAAAAVLAEDGVALTVQNGIGNVEQLVAALGSTRVIGGSTMSSFRTNAPGWLTMTHGAPTTIGELDGADTPRLRAVRDALMAAGFETVTTPDIMSVIWSKFLLNLAINPICAATFLRLGEFARCEATDRFQDHILDEAFAVIRAKGLKLDLEALRAKVKAHSWAKYSKPSMLQHLERGRQTEIDALNGALVREGAALGVPTPFNEALTLLVKGCEIYHARRVAGTELDEAALEAAAARTPRPSPAG
jgi:2-dehydropantoate 2-reductase